MKNVFCEFSAILTFDLWSPKSNSSLNPGFKEITELSSHCHRELINITRNTFSVFCLNKIRSWVKAQGKEKSDFLLFLLWFFLFHTGYRITFHSEINEFLCNQIKVCDRRVWILSNWSVSKIQIWIKSAHSWILSPCLSLPLQWLCPWTFGPRPHLGWPHICPVFTGWRSCRLMKH